MPPSPMPIRYAFRRSVLEMAGLAWLCFSLGRLGLAFFAAAMGGLALLMIGRSRPRRLDPLAPPADLLPDVPASRNG